MMRYNNKLTMYFNITKVLTIVSEYVTVSVISQLVSYFFNYSIISIVIGLIKALVLIIMISIRLQHEFQSANNHSNYEEKMVC